jgi:hypothetical protein
MHLFFFFKEPSCVVVQLKSGSRFGFILRAHTLFSELKMSCMKVVTQFVLLDFYFIRKFRLEKMVVDMFFVWLCQKKKF